MYTIFDQIFGITVNHVTVPLNPLVNIRAIKDNLGNCGILTYNASTCHPKPDKKGGQWGVWDLFTQIIASATKNINLFYVSFKRGLELNTQIVLDIYYIGGEILHFVIFSNHDSLKLPSNTNTPINVELRPFLACGKIHLQ